MGEERRGREGLVAEACWPVVTMTSALRCSARGSHECCSLHHAGSPCTGASAHPGPETKEFTEIQRTRSSTSGLITSRSLGCVTSGT